jgi:hypothetical protein
MIGVVGAVSVILTVALVLAIQALYYAYQQSETERKVVAVPAVTSESQLAVQKAKLARYGWKNQAEGQALIPIERAMELVVRELRSEQEDR